jgi:tetratricopeptide (TPR) repeat protein
MAIVMVQGCATLAARRAPTPVDQFSAGAARLEAGDLERARDALGEALAHNPADPTRQTLLALTYHAAPGAGADDLRLALAGYQSALRAAPQHYWASVLAGRASFELGEYRTASSHFATAAMQTPEDPRTLLGLAAAAYMNGDPALASLVADRAEALGEGQNAAEALRLAALAHAAMGEEREAETRLIRLDRLDPALAAATRLRVARLVRTAAVDAQDPSAPDAPASSSPAPPPDQIAVDVVIVLAQNAQRDRIGLNLLDGLRLQYSYRNESRETRENGSDPFQRTITDAISIPDLAYNLNIFNRFGQYYQVAARPTLTAHLGELSEFFVGRTLKVEVNGINSGQLEQIDVGIRLRATPIEIDGAGTKVRIEAERSFVSAEPAGTFAEALSTFRQTVSATARVQFGETLVLSGLSESVNDSTVSKTPVLGDVPIVGNAFNERNRLERRDAVLILVTPSAPVAFASEPWARPRAVERIIDLWSSLVDPATNSADVTARLRRMRLFSRMVPGDAPLQWPSPAAQTGELVREILAP